MSEYRYTECGLDNVIIDGIEVLIDDAGEEVYSIPNLPGLHRLIAHCIVTQGQSLSGRELRFLRTELGLTQGELAALIKKDHQTIGRWERGEIQIDPNAEFVIRVVAAERMKLPIDISWEEVVRGCVPAVAVPVIRIDGSNPRSYRRLAA